MANVVDVARYITKACGAMSAMKLQKLVYYSQAWHLVHEGEPLFDAKIQAWANGPVVRELYDWHRGRFIVNEATFTHRSDPGCELAENEAQTVDAVLEAYGDISAHDLSNLTHSERPWSEARAGLADGERAEVVISLATMQEFYEEQLRESMAK